MFKLMKMTTALAVASVLAFAIPVSAAGEGQVEGGDIYRIKNLTKNVDFVDPANADACDTLVYKVRLHNPGPGTLVNVNVKAAFSGAEGTSNTSTLTASSANADPASTSDTATLNMSSSRSLSYVSGSTQLLDANNGFIRTLPEGITQGGVNLGDIGVSIDNKRFVQFQVKVSCPVAPVVTPAAVAPVTAKALPNTGPGAALGLFAGASAVGSAAHFAVRRLRSRA